MRLVLCKNLPIINLFLFALMLIFSVGFSLANISVRNPLHKITEYKLVNGMRVILLERHSLPLVAGGWVVNVGSANEHKGVTGMAHMYEHMMFKGTKVIGTKDYKSEQKIIKQQDRLHKSLSATTDPAQQKKIKQQLSMLKQQQSALSVKSEYNQIYRRNGESGINAYTTYDHTAYFLTLPSNKLELFMWMESERLRDPVFREFYTERDAVLDERRQRVESSAESMLENKFDSQYWQGTPFAAQVIGLKKDIESFYRPDAKKFLKYYTPRNITLVLVGDFKTQQVLPMIKLYFGRLSNNSAKLKYPSVDEFNSNLVVMTASIQAIPSVSLRFPTKSISSPDQYALDVLSELMSSNTGDLKQQLQLGNLSSSTYADSYANKYAGYFQLYADARKVEDLPEIQAKMINILNGYKTKVDKNMLAIEKRNIILDYYRQLDSNYNLLKLLLSVAADKNGVKMLQHYPQKINGVTALDIKRVAQQYFDADKASVLTVKRAV